MDSLTHVVAGGLTPFLFKSTPKRWSFLVFGIVAGSFPDIDIFWSGDSLYSMLVLHRGISHAIIVQFVSALILSFLFYLYLKKKPTYYEMGTKKEYSLVINYRFFSHLFVIALVALLFHLFLDSMTLFGTKIYLPFSETRVGLPALFIVDLLFTGFALFCLIKAIKATADTMRRWAIIGLLWMFIYPLCCLSFSYAMGASLQKEKKLASPVLLMPKPFSPFVWKVVFDEPEKMILANYSLLNGLELDRQLEYQKIKKELLQSFSEQVPLLGIYADFSPTLVLLSKSSCAAKDGGVLNLYSLTDVRYINESKVAILKDREVMFVMQVLTNEDNKVLAYRLLPKSSLNFFQEKTNNCGDLQKEGDWVRLVL